MCSGEGTYAPQFSGLDNTTTSNIKLGSMDGGTALHAKPEAPTSTTNSVLRTRAKDGKNADSDHTDHDSDEDYPGH
eukprot:9560583-Heterocapsa_arctica.AAC.1